MKLAVVSAPDNANIIADIETNELASILVLYFGLYISMLMELFENNYRHKCHHYK